MSDFVAGAIDVKKGVGFVGCPTSQSLAYWITVFVIGAFLAVVSRQR
jgi:hypothetical protein